MGNMCIYISKLRVLAIIGCICYTDACLGAERRLVTWSAICVIRLDTFRGADWRTIYNCITSIRPTGPQKTRGVASIGTIMTHCVSRALGIMIKLCGHPTNNSRGTTDPTYVRKLIVLGPVSCSLLKLACFLVLSMCVNWVSFLVK